MNQTGFGHRFDWKEVAEWMECSEEEADVFLCAVDMNFLVKLNLGNI